MRYALPIFAAVLWLSGLAAILNSLDGVSPKADRLDLNTTVVHKNIATE